MANYCYNHIIFTGTTTNLVALIKYINENFKQAPEDSTNELDLLRMDTLHGRNDLITVYGARNFEVAVLELRSSNSLYIDVLHNTPTEDAVLGQDGLVTMTGESPWSPIRGLISILCRKFGLQAEYDYEEGRNFMGCALICADGTINEIEYDTYWQAMAALEPNRYVCTAVEDFEQFEDMAEFTTSDIALHAPSDLKEQLLLEFEQYWSNIDR